MQRRRWFCDDYNLPHCVVLGPLVAVPVLPRPVDLAAVAAHDDRAAPRVARQADPGRVVDAAHGHLDDLLNDGKKNKEAHGQWPRCALSSRLLLLLQLLGE